MTKKEFLHTIAATVCEVKMLEQKDSVLAAVSGGPDSVALLLSLLSLKEKYALTIGIAHLNHLLRGDASLRDEAFVRDLALGLNLPFHCEQTDVQAYARTHGLSVEEAGRDVRYDFFKRVSHRHGYQKIATGHNKNDNAELVLMNLLRGAGPKGLSGIPAMRENLYIRPLIHVLKNQILNFLADEKQDYMLDDSNTDTTYLRNKIRYQLIPYLESEFNPEMIDALDRLSQILSQEEAYLDAETKKQFMGCLVQMDAASVTFSKTRLSDLPPALLSRVVRKGIMMIKKDLKRISLIHMKDMADFCLNPSSGISLDLPDQIRIYKNKDTLMIKKETSPLREVGKKEKQLRRMARKKQG